MAIVTNSPVEMLASEVPARPLATARPRILVVDDEIAAGRAIATLLNAEGFTAAAVPNGEAAFDEIQRALPDLVLADLHMPELDGVELCRRVHALAPELPVIVMTADPEMERVIESLRAGAEDYLTKPLQADAVLWSVERALARRASKREQQEIRRTLNERLVISSIREQELAEAEARQRRHLSMLLSNLSDGVVVCDRSGRVLTVSDAARAILGFELDGLRTVHEAPLEAFDLEGRAVPAESHPFSRAVGGETFTDCEVVIVRPNGERRRVLFSATNARDENESLAMTLIVFRDVTELRSLEKQRDEYLALITHDIRNPLSVVMMSLSALQRSLGASTELAAPAIFADIERAVRNATRMNVMLHELTEATSLESRGAALRLVACDLRGVVGNVVDSIDDERARRITVEATDGSPYLVSADAARLERVVANLVTNALKYSEGDAPVTLRLTRGANDVSLAVVDQGSGIAPDGVGRLFERYYRTPPGKVRASGLGLGLYIAHLIVEAHGGRIEVSSKLGEGSTFTLVLPPFSGEA